MNYLTDIPAGEADKINVIIEIPEGSRNKYEYDKEHNIFALDRVCQSKFAYPYDYGFVPQTLCDDGDPLDAVVLMRYKTYPGILVKVRPVAVLRMEDDGEQDDKLICVPVTDKYYDGVTDKKDLPEQLFKELVHFYEHYKDVKGGKVTITAVEGVSSAKKVFEDAVKMYSQK